MSIFNQISWTMLNWFDFLIIIIFSLSMLISFMRGLIREFIALAIWFLAFILSIIYAPNLSNHLSNIESGPMRYTLAFLIIFLSILLFGVVISAVASALVSKTGIGFVDRFCGLLFGFVRGALLVSVLLMLAGVTGIKSNGVEQSQLAPVFSPLVNWLSASLPEKLDSVKAWKHLDNPNKAMGNL